MRINLFRKLSCFSLFLVLITISFAGPINAEVSGEDFNTAPGRYNSIKAGDIDGDGKIELVYGDYNGYVTVLEYVRGDFFLEYSLEVGGNRVWGIELGDVYGDDGVEIVVGNGMGKIFVFSGEDGKLLWKYEGSGRDAHGIALHDFTGDGKDDIVVGTAYKTDEPNGMFYVIECGTDKPFFMTAKANSRWRAIDVGDVDGDGIVEVVAGCGAALGDVAGEGYIRVYNVTNNSRGKPEWESDDLGGCVQGLAIRDVDNDGTPNIVLSNGYRYNDGWIYIFQYDPADGIYKKLYKSGNLGPKPFGFAVADVDDDDVEEIMVGNQPGYLYIIDGMTHDIEWKSPLLGTDVMGITAVDLDADPQLEIIAAQGGYQGKGDYTSGYTSPHIYVIDGKTHDIEIILGETDVFKLILQIILLVLVILFLVELSVLTKSIRKGRGRV